MARRKKGRGKGGRKAIPLLMLAPLVPVVQGVVWNVQNHTLKDIPRSILRESTGILVDPNGNYQFESEKAVRELGLAIGGIIGHKIANKMGVNKHVKKFTLGYFQL